MFGDDHLFWIIYSQDLNKGLPQFRAKGQGTSAKEYPALYISATGKGAYSLEGSCMKYRCGYVFSGDAPAQEGLEIGLGKDAAAGCNGVYAGSLSGKVIEFGNRHIQKNGHLVNECACTTGATSVHSYVRPKVVIKKNNLGIFPAHFYEGPDIKIYIFDKAGRGHHLLDKRNVKRLSRPHAGGACYRDLNRDISQLVKGFLKDVSRHLYGLTLMTLIAGKEEPVEAVIYHHLCRGGADINPCRITHLPFICHGFSG